MLFYVSNIICYIFSLFDTCVRMYDVYKVKTFGESSMVASGVPVPNGKRHAREIGLMALKIHENVRRYNIPHLPLMKLEMRSGIHSG